VSREAGERRETGKRREPVNGRGPPRLRLGLLHKLKVLAFANAIPLGIVAFVCFQISTGKMGIRDDVPTGKVGFWVALLLVCCLVMGVSSWFVMPTVRWLRDYSAWHYRNATPTVWLLPMLAGWLIWLSTWMLMTLCAIGMVALLAIGIWSLLGVVQGMDQRPVPGATQVDSPGPGALDR
jgi:hypothetical protein